MESLKSMISENEVERLVRANITLQIGCYFSKTQPCLSGLVTTSKWIEDYYWNSLSLFRETSLSNLLQSAEPLFLAENRNLAIYLDPSCRPVNTADHLVHEGFSYEREVWMSPVSIPSPRTSKFEITRVSPSDIDDFLKVFSIGFGGPATEADGYGDIPPTYLSALKDSFNGHASAGVEHVHLIARSGGRAVGCGSVHIGKHLAGVYNVTTLPEFRKRGIGTVVSIEAFLIAANRGATRIFFQTQPEGSVQKFYEGLGCAVIFEAALFHRG